MAERTIGEHLTELRKRSGLTLEGFASALGLKGKSSVQRFFKADLDRVSVADALRLADVFAGKGTPPITREEVFSVTGVSVLGFPPGNATPIQFEGASAKRMRDDLPVYGTALGAAKIIDGEAIEQTTLNQGDIVAYAKRPVILNGNSKAYGLYVQGSSMEPVHRDGSLILAERDRPLRVGDDVVVYLRPHGEEHMADDGDSARCVLVKRLVRRTAAYVELQQFSPAVTFQLAASDILKIDRVLTMDDLLS